mgnify:CR=1 FL=1
MSDSSSIGTPSKCLYINNINEKVKVDVLKKTLNMIFSQYGRVTSITAYSGLKTRGQAWVTFETESAACAALKAKQGFNFYDKPLKLQFSSKGGGSNGTSVKLEKDVDAVEESAGSRKRARS